jgi:FHA domain-containing protein/von Willebrand factor type A domain-containing protein
MRRCPAARTLAVAILLGLVPSPGRADPPPALVAVLLDSSGSVAPRELDRARQLAKDVLRRLPPGGEVAVFTFDDQSRLVLPRTSRAEDVERALAGVRISGRHTALYDGLYDASRYLRESGVARCAILLITDGKDEQSALNLDDGLRLAQEGRIPVFAVGVGQVEERVLRRIAKLTGGQYHGAREADGAALASAILAAPADDARAASSAAALPAPPPAGKAAAPPRPAEPSPEPETRGSRILRWLRIPAALLLVATVAVVLLALRKPRPRCATCRRELPDALSTCAFCAERSRGGGAAPSRLEREAAVAEMSATVVSRIGSTEEYLEKTVVLRERPILAVTRGPLAGQVFELSGTSATSLGRAKANDVVLDDVSISSQHCRIRPEEDGFTLLDLKSTNGTFVNERRVTAHKLAEGDVIRLGEMQLQFRMDQRRG